MAQFMVDTGAVRQKAAQVNSYAEQYDVLRAKLLNVASSMGAAYDSKDNREYVSRITECCQQLIEVSNRLRNAAQEMTAQSRRYDATEDENSMQARRLP